MKTIFTFALLFMFNLTASYAQGDVLWEFRISDRVYSSPIIDGDILYFGGGNGNFYALNKHTGGKTWEFKTNAAIHSTAFIHNNLISFASGDGAK